MLKTNKAREVAGVFIAVASLCTVGALACNVDVISGDDGEGGQGGQGVTTVGTVTTSGNDPSTTAAVTTVSVVSTVGSGGCPPEATWPSDCASVAATGAGTGGGPKHCFWEQGDCAPAGALMIDCDETTGLCTCEGSGMSCSCKWEIPGEGAFCGTPCCGGDPGTF